jgi:hypothetical protein
MLETAEDFARRSPALRLLSVQDQDDEWRSLWLFLTATLVRGSDGQVRAAGPVTVGIRYHESFVAQAPHPAEIVTVLSPFIFHPNASPANSLCLGHPEAGLALDFILHQTWAGLTLNMKAVDTGRGRIFNAEAARWVRTNAEHLPLTEKGIFEEPDFAGSAGFDVPFD